MPRSSVRAPLAERDTNLRWISTRERGRHVCCTCLSVARRQKAARNLRECTSLVQGKRAREGVGRLQRACCPSSPTGTILESFVVVLITITTDLSLSKHKRSVAPQAASASANTKTFLPLCAANAQARRGKTAAFDCGCHLGVRSHPAAQRHARAATHRGGTTPRVSLDRKNQQRCKPDRSPRPAGAAWPAPPLARRSAPRRARASSVAARRLALRE